MTDREVESRQAIEHLRKSTEAIRHQIETSRSLISESVALLRTLPLCPAPFAETRVMPDEGSLDSER